MDLFDPLLYFVLIVPFKQLSFSYFALKTKLSLPFIHLVLVSRKLASELLLLFIEPNCFLFCPKRVKSNMICFFRDCALQQYISFHIIIIDIFLLEFFRSLTLLYFVA